MNCCNAYMFDEKFTYPLFNSYDTDFYLCKDKYSNTIKKYIKKYIWKKKLPILWKIAEYYTMKKYHPNSNAILDYIYNY